METGKEDVGSENDRDSDSDSDSLNDAADEDEDEEDDASFSDEIGEEEFVIAADEAD
jgi:hypothetical protein